MGISVKTDTKGSVLLKVGLPLALIVLGVGAWVIFSLTTPEIKRKHHAALPTVVEVATAADSTAVAYISAMGKVEAATEVDLRSRSSGDVLSLGDGFTPGGHVAKGDVMIRLDKVDYEIELQKAQATLSTAQADLAIEQGSQAVAKEEMRLMSQAAGEEIKATDLILRAPQLQQAMADVASAKAAVRKAKLDLDRTVVRAPFNALIIERNVNLGSHVKAQESIATIVGTDEYWVEAVLPLDRLYALHLGKEGGSEAIVSSQAAGGSWKGRVTRLAGKLTETGRMAKVIISVPDPLGLKEKTNAPQLILDDYVSVRIAGKPMKNVIKLPRRALRDGKYVWVLKDGKLDIRSVKTAWKQSDSVFIASGLEAGEKIIMSDLATPVQGMILRAADETRQPEPDRTASAEGDYK